MMPRLSIFQAHPKAKKWRTSRFPLYDEIAVLVDGIVATGEGAFHAGSDSLAFTGNFGTACDGRPGTDDPDIQLQDTSQASTDSGKDHVCYFFVVSRRN